MQKKQDSFRVCSFYIHSKSDVNTILDLIRVEKYVDNIQIFHLLWGLIWKILTGKYCEDSAWAECLKLYDKKKSSKRFCLVCQKIIAMIADPVVCERYLKWNHSRWTFFKKYTETWYYKIEFENWYWKLCKMKYIKCNLTTRHFDKTCPQYQIWGP